jgi:branched-chain amino acid transport system permease protein
MLTLALVWPYFGPQYQVYLSLSYLSYSVALLGFNLLFNYAGLLSMGHAMFIGFGGYSAAFITSRYQVPYIEVSILAAVMISAILGTVVGLICVRYTKIYFAMLTLAFGMLFHSFLLKSYHLTGGDEGMTVSQPHLLGMDFSSMGRMEFLTGPFYYYCLGILILAALVMWRIVQSPFGLCLKSVRDNPNKAEYLGLGIKKYRLYAFIISGCFAGVGGVMMGSTTGHMDISMVFWTHSGDLVFMTLLGGFSNFLGPMLGSIIFVYLKDLISSMTEYWRFIFGGLLAFIVIIAPGGIAGVISSLVKKEKRDEPR